MRINVKRIGIMSIPLSNVGNGNSRYKKLFNLKMGITDVHRNEPI